MRHMTPLDAFNAAAGLTNQTLNILTKEREYEIDTDIHLRSIDQAGVLHDLINAYTHTYVDADGNSNPWHQDAEGYKQYVNDKLNEWKKQQIEDAQAKGLNSRYFQQRLDELDKQGRLAMAQRYSAAIVEVEKQRTAVVDTKATAQIENANLDAVSRFNARFNQLELTREAGTGNVMDPAQEYARKTDIFTSTYDQALNVDIGNMTIAQAEAQRERQVSAWEAEAGKRLAKGETTGQYIQNKNNLDKAAKESTISAIWNRNKTEAERKHQIFKDMVQRAVGSEDQALIQSVLTKQREGLRFKAQAVNSPEYDPDFRNEMLTWYQLPASLDPDKDKDKDKGGGDIATVATVRTNMERIFDDLFGRKMPGVTIHSLKPQMLDILYKEAWERGSYRKSKDEFAYEFSPALNEYFKIAEERYNNDPARKGTTTIVKDWFKNNARDDAWLRRNYPEFGEYFAKQLLNFHFDTIASLDWSDATGETVLGAVKDFMATLRGEGLDMITRRNIDYSKPSNLSKALMQRDSDTNIMYTTIEGNIETMPGPQNEIGRVQKNLNEINKVSASWLEQAFDLEQGRLIPINKQPDSYDIDAETYFQYGDTGTFYRAKGNSDGSVTLQKAEGLGGQWGSDKTISGKDAGFNIWEALRQGKEWVEGQARRILGSSELQAAASTHAGRVEAANRLTEQLANARGTDGKPFPVPGFKETDTKSLYYFDQHRTALEKYINDNGAERYLKWLRENHADILPEAWKK